MSGPILNSVNMSKQKHPAITDAAVNKESMVSCFRLFGVPIFLGFLFKNQIMILDSLIMNVT